MKIIDTYIQEGLFGPKIIEDEVAGELKLYKPWWIGWVDIGEYKDIALHFTAHDKEGLNDDQRKSFNQLKKCLPLFPEMIKKSYQALLRSVEPKYLNEFKEQYPFNKNDFYIFNVSVSSAPGRYSFAIGWKYEGRYSLLSIVDKFKISETHFTSVGQIILFDKSNSFIKTKPFSISNIKVKLMVNKFIK